MENGFSVLMLIFGGALLLYAAVLSTGNYKLLPYHIIPSLKSDDRAGQTKHIAAITARIALCPLIGGLLGLFLGNTACLIGMGVTAAVLIVLAVLRKKGKPDV